MVVRWRQVTGRSLYRISELPLAVVQKTVVDAAVAMLRIMDVRL
jgi:hypothetical protein